MARIGLIPDPKRVLQLEQIYTKSQLYISSQIFSIDLQNYSDVLASKIRQNVSIEVQRLNLKAMMWSRVAIPEAYNQARARGERILVDGGMDKDTNYNTSNHRKTIDKGIEKTQRILLKANLSIVPQVNIYLMLLKGGSKLVIQADIQELERVDRLVVNKIIQEGIEEQLSLRKMSKAIGQYFRGQFKTGAFIRINGRNYKMRPYAEMVARTQMRILQSAATRNVCKQFKNDLVAWSDHYQRVPDVECTPYAGNVYSWSGNSTRYRKIPEIPPTHPRCEHHLNPVPDILVRLEPKRFPSTIGQIHFRRAS